MRRIISFSLLLAGLAFYSAVSTQAQSYDLSWHTIAGGGGTSAGTNTNSVVYSVSGTIGQADAGNMSGGGYSLTGGFWGILVAVQTPGAPFLTIQPATSGHVTLSWAATFPGYTPQQNPSLGTTNWSLVNTNTFPIVLNAGTNSVTLPVSGNQYFRLSHP